MNVAPKSLVLAALGSEPLGDLTDVEVHELAHVTVELAAARFLTVPNQRRRARALWAGGHRDEARALARSARASLGGLAEARPLSKEIDHWLADK